MRKLAWFSAGFAAACLWACHGDMGAVPLGAAAVLLGLMLAVWLRVRLRENERPILLRRPKEKGPLSRHTLYRISRRGVALCLGGLGSSLWSCSAVRKG